MVRRAAVAGALLAAALAAVDAAVASAATGRIAYADRVSEGRWDLFTVRGDGRERRHLTRGRALDAEPAWSPDRRLVAFARIAHGDAALYVVRRDGTGLRRIPHTRGGGEPSWAPGGGTLAFVRQRGRGRRAVFRVGLDGGGVRRLTAWSFDVFDADWSPDGGAIAYGTRKAIKVMRPDGSDKRDLIRGGRAPSWSPDGSRIAYIAEVERDGTRVADVFTANGDGSDVRNLTRSRPIAVCEPAADCRRFAEDVTWNPAGTRLAFDEYTIGRGTNGIFSVSQAGDGIRRVNRSGWEPDW